jgi:hypothetical protein
MYALNFAKSLIDQAKSLAIVVFTIHDVLSVAHKEDMACWPGRHMFCCITQTIRLWYVFLMLLSHIDFNRP